MKKWIALVLAMVALAPVGAFGQDFSLGASPEAVGSGARALGQGNAFIAVADDATAASWNPGGLAQLEKPEISFALESLRRRSHMDVPDHPESSTIHTVQLEDLNYLSVVYPFQGFGRHMVFSLNYLKQYRLDQDFFTHTTQDLGFMVVDNDYILDQTGDLSVLAPALALDITPKLSLGLTFNVWNDDLTGASNYRRRIHQVETQSFFGVPAPPWDYYFNDDVSVDDGYSAALGVMYRLSKELTFGAVVKPAYELDLVSKGENITIDNFGTVTTTPRNGSTETHMPWTVGAGVAWRPTDPFTLSADLTWTQWSKYKVYDSAFNSAENPRNPISRERYSDDQCEDTVALRLGMEYLVIRAGYVLPLRCGLAYDPAPAVDEIDECYAGTVGVGYQRGRFMIDLAYEYRWGRNLTGGGVLGYPDTTEDTERHRLLMSLIVYL